MIRYRLQNRGIVSVLKLKMSLKARIFFAQVRKGVVWEVNFVSLLSFV